MGTEIRQVPPDFKHPSDEEGYHIPGAHHELLYSAGADACTCFQLYENVTEGTPVSPIFESKLELAAWLADEGCPQATIEMLINWGHAPSFVIQTQAER